MGNHQTIAQQLQQFGLSLNQSQVYLALIKHGELRVQAIANAANIPRTSVYESITALLKIGLIEKIIDHKFVRIRAYPLSNLRRGLDEQLLQVQQQLINLAKLEKTVILLPSTLTNTTAVIRYYKGVIGARQLFDNSLQTNSTVLVYSSYGRSAYLGKKFYASFVAESREKGITEKVLINPTLNTLQLIKRDTGSTIARTKIADLRFLPEKNLVIKGETLIYDNIFAQIDLQADEINGFEIESSGVAQMQKSIFETLWRTAEPVAPLVT